MGINDIQKFVEILKAFGLTETSNKSVDINEYKITEINANNNQHEYHKDGLNITIGAGLGYGIGEFYFDPEGKARNYGLWE
jgi:hypothetical protein